MVLILTTSSHRQIIKSTRLNISIIFVLSSRFLVFVQQSKDDDFSQPPRPLKKLGVYILMPAIQKERDADQNSNRSGGVVVGVRGYINRESRLNRQ